MFNVVIVSFVQDTVGAVGDSRITYQLRVVMDRCGEEQGIIYNNFRVRSLPTRPVLT